MCTCTYSTKVNEGAVAGDDLETSVYYVKDALDANVTYAAAPQVHTVGARGQGGRREEGSSGESEEGEGAWGGKEDVDMPDIGEGEGGPVQLTACVHELVYLLHESVYLLHKSVFLPHKSVH